MKISKLSEHIGSGSLMFHVRVYDDHHRYTATVFEGLVAADNEDQALRTAVAHAYAYSSPEDVPDELLRDSGAVAGLIGEVE